MSKREAISRYNLIIQKLRKAPATFEEIAGYLNRESELQGYNFTISKRTFDRDKEDIASLFNIEIRYDHSERKYIIDSELEPEANERIFEAFDTFNALNVTDRLSAYIHFEKRRPRGTEHLYGLLHAIKSKVRVVFTYLKYWEDSTTRRMVEPYALKEFKNRWYVLARDLKDAKIKSFALDRLSDLAISQTKFEWPAHFDINTYYRYYFGIIGSGSGKPEEVILSFEPFQGKYIKSLPLHESQQTLIDNDTELRVKLTVYPTYDFVQEILSHGESVKVLSPQRLIDEIKASLAKALKQY
ncbi:MAG: WYL domain-containing protein [Paludibacteraceae bacterium]|nr:WYL domain-containing protein [Paludibacteraceae bacterium]